LAWLWRRVPTGAMVQIFRWGGDGADLLPVGAAMERNFFISSMSTDRDLGVFCFFRSEKWEDVRGIRYISSISVFWFLLFLAGVSIGYCLIGGQKTHVYCNGQTEGTLK
jgi:hypothetical protein